MIRFVLITIALIFGANIVSASNDISQFVFTTPPQTIKPNEISEIITIQSQDANGNSATSTQTICLELASTSNTGEFSSSNTNWSSVKILTMNKGWANRNFYYKDSTVGTYELSLKISLKPDGKPACASWPKEEWDIKWSIKQSIIVSSEPSSSSSQNSSSVSSVANSGGGSVYWPDEQQIYANAGKDKTGIAGADVLFEGKALGIKKEPLENARYLWNLGDWSYKEGKNIRHIYKYPGNYIVTLEVSPRDGDVSASDRINIKVIPNELQIIDANDEFIKLKNKSDVILDVSGWFLKVGGSIFKAPNGSLIRANSELIISSDVSGLKFADKKFSAEILYPNGSVAFSYLPAGQASSSPVASSSSSKPKEIVLSKPPEKNINIAIVPIIPQKNSSSSSTTTNSSQSFPEPTTVVGFATTTQLASVITIGEKNNSGAKIWLILAVITGIIGGAGIFLARRNNQTPQN